MKSTRKIWYGRPTKLKIKTKTTSRIKPHRILIIQEDKGEEVEVVDRIQTKRTQITTTSKNKFRQERLIKKKDFSATMKLKSWTPSSKWWISNSAHKMLTQVMEYVKAWTISIHLQVGKAKGVKITTICNNKIKDVRTTNLKIWDIISREIEIRECQTTIHTNSSNSHIQTWTAWIQMTPTLCSLWTVYQEWQTYQGCSSSTSTIIIREHIMGSQDKFLTIWDLKASQEASQIVSSISLE